MPPSLLPPALKYRLRLGMPEPAPGETALHQPLESDRGLQNDQRSNIRGLTSRTQGADCPGLPRLPPLGVPSICSVYQIPLRRSANRPAVAGGKPKGKHRKSNAQFAI